MNITPCRAPSLMKIHFPLQIILRRTTLLAANHSLRHMMKHFFKPVLTVCFSEQRVTFCDPQYTDYCLATLFFSIPMNVFLFREFFSSRHASQSHYRMSARTWMWWSPRGQQLVAGYREGTDKSRFVEFWDFLRRNDIEAETDKKRYGAKVNYRVSELGSVLFKALFSMERAELLHYYTLEYYIFGTKKHETLLVKKVTSTNSLSVVNIPILLSHCAVFTRNIIKTRYHWTELGTLQAFYFKMLIKRTFFNSNNGSQVAHLVPLAWKWDYYELFSFWKICGQHVGTMEGHTEVKNRSKKDKFSLERLDE